MTGNAQMTPDTKSSLIKDVSLILLGWVLGLFTLPFARDSEAKEKCLNKLNDLKRVLESLAKHMKNSRSEQQYYGHLIQAKTLFEDLNVNRTGLLFCPRDLTAMLAESLSIMRQLDPSHQNFAYHPNQTAVRIAMLWNGDQPISRDFGSIDEIQRLIGRTFPGRFSGWVSSFTKRAFSRKKDTKGI